MNWSDFWMNAGQLLPGVVLGLLAIGGSWLTRYLKKIKKSMSHTINDNVMLKQLLAEIRSYYDADRVQLFQFHNGNYYVSGGSIQKVSMTHFVMGRGVSVPFEATHQNIPIGYIATTTDEILNRPYVFYTSQDLNDDSYFKGLLRYGGAKSALLRGIYSQKQEMIGFIAVTWFDNVTLTKEQLGAVKDFSMQLRDEMLMGVR